ncbi:TRAP transporter large permease [Sulfitobacter sp. 915]|uniref:TRAP transporter large permease n=1 Tax=Sulfitobacter sp. 915 TaxID=3368558 RepID=UPI00374679DD
MTSAILVLIGMLASAVPIAVILGLFSIVGLWMMDIPPVAALQSSLESLDSFSLMAVPFYVLAGNIMRAGGISDRLVSLANALVGWFRGGLGAAVVLTCMFFATISGSSSATTAAVGGITIPAMVKKRYPNNFSAATVAAAGELGAIIPPSLPMIVYALVMGVSAADLFIAGIIPGILIGASLMLVVIVTSRLKGFDEVPLQSGSEWAANLMSASKRAAPAMVIPVIILGGIYSGSFTPTEAAVVASIAGFVISTLVFRQMSFASAVDTFKRSALTSAGLLLIVASASAFGFFLTINMIPQTIGGWITAISDDPIAFLLIVNCVLFATGMFMETLAAIIVLGPILAPVAQSFGIDPVHFGLIMIANLATGMVTPPVGVNLFVACEVAGLRIDQIIRPLLLFLGTLIFDVLLITYLPLLH